LRLESLLALRTLDLERRSEKVVLYAKCFMAHMNGSQRLKAANLIRLAWKIESIDEGRRKQEKDTNFVHVIKNHLDNGRVLCELCGLVVVFHSFLFRPRLKNFEVRDNNANKARLEGIAIDPVLCNPFRLHEDIFELLWRDVLAKRNLEDIL
jgi:hypothetical protein